VKHHKSSAFALVRTRARAVMKKLGINKCENCGYDKHIEVAHIKAIGLFTLETLINIINSPRNLLALCPNYHWEYDHSLLEKTTLNEIAHKRVELFNRI
jgi:predicted restriction endonuclease